ncbi:hypothetical protein [Paenibacillus shenyangensis]|uniref:hypothetical protein n=1 Tax=Paenibacillus sp. A9 TaxID=1284352 RepID=UPI00036B384E|nr:hypothetical protein [Paenibacillus sp. A9]
MQYIIAYTKAIKALNKKYYLTPFLLLMYSSLIINISRVVTRFIEDGQYSLGDLTLFFVAFIQVYALSFIKILFYPHASFYIQSTYLYQKIFGSFFGNIKSSFLRYISVGNNIPDDFTAYSSRGEKYTISYGYKSKLTRVDEARTMQLILFFFKFFFKDLVLRIFTHLLIYTFSPLLFLIAVPLLNKKGILSNIEK